MNIKIFPQSVGADYHVISDDETHADVFYSAIAFKDDAEIEAFVIEAQAKRDEAEQAQKNYIPPEQLKIQELEAVIVEKEQIIDAKVAYVADLTKQIVDAKLVPVKEPIKPIIKEVLEVKL